MSTLSVIVITKNEGRNIARCLQSVAFADQIVVLDSGSADATVQIAHSLGAEVSTDTDWRGFGLQKNRALSRARCEWVLSLDADEHLTPQLQVEIRSAMKAGEYDVFSFPRRSSFCGQYIRHSGWTPDRVTRLFKRGMASFSNDLVHEKVVTGALVGKLTSAVLHETYVDLESVLDKANRYSSAGAEGLLRASNKKGSLASALLHGMWAFVRTYLLRLGFLDGQLGLVLALSVAETTYYRYLKLWLLQKQGALEGSTNRSSR